jgi:hypothetical protein
LTDKICIAGYDTSASLLLADLPASTNTLSDRARRSHGPLGRRSAIQQQSLDGVLLVGALGRAALSKIAAYALIVEAKDEAAAAFYRHHGFIALSDPPLILSLPLATSRFSKTNHENSAIRRTGHIASRIPIQVPYAFNAFAAHCHKLGTLRAALIKAPLYQLS